MSYYSKTVPIEEMWQLIENYGIKRDMLERANINDEEISQLYWLIRKNKRMRRDIQTVSLLKEYIEKIKRHNKS